MGSPWTWAGSAAKAFKNILRTPSARIITGDTDDPTVVAKEGEISAVYFRAGTPGIYRKDDAGTTTNWTELGAGGGGGGGSANFAFPVNWSAGPGITTESLGDSIAMVFPLATDNTIYGELTVPAAYNSGSQIKVYLPHYVNSTGNMVWEAQVTLYRANASDDVSATPTNQEVFSSTIAAPATGNRLGTAESLVITDANGEVDGVAVSEKDVLVIALTHKGTSGSRTIVAAPRIFDPVIAVPVSVPTAAGGAAVTVKTDVLTGPLAPYEIIDGYFRWRSSESITGIAITVTNSGTSGSTTVELNRDGTSGAATKTGSIASAAGARATTTVTFGAALSVQDGDYTWFDINSVAGGSPEDISITPILA